MRAIPACCLVLISVVASAQTADVSVTAAGAAAATAGDLITYTVVITNHGPDAPPIHLAFTGPVYFSPAPPAGMTCTPAPSHTPLPNPVPVAIIWNCTSASLASGGILTVPFSATIPVRERTQRLMSSVAVNVNQDDPDITNNFASVTTELTGLGTIPAMGPFALVLMAAALAAVALSAGART